jgi:CHAT domain-containing protein
LASRRRSFTYPERVKVESTATTLQIDQSDIKLGLDATETAVKSAKLDDYRVVYFATHGLVADDPEIYKLWKVEPALAPQDQMNRASLMTAFFLQARMAQLKMNADWVVLSGCNTSTGDKPGAEATLSGLARAFYAGIQFTFGFALEGRRR